MAETTQHVASSLKMPLCSPTRWTTRHVGSDATRFPPGRAAKLKISPPRGRKGGPERTALFSWRVSIHARGRPGAWTAATGESCRMAEGCFGAPFFMSDPALPDPTFATWPTTVPGSRSLLPPAATAVVAIRYGDVGTLLRDPCLSADRTKDFVGQARAGRCARISAGPRPRSRSGC
jgi:hypothetical protein